ncbi:hypothetical protein HG530_014312 [Fusarium avenaceum]|nr:hypothetical protein HG530_014312 [Fusarium avenaceum]
MLLEPLVENRSDASSTPGLLDHLDSLIVRISVVELRLLCILELAHPFEPHVKVFDPQRPTHDMPHLSHALSNSEVRQLRRSETAAHDKDIRLSPCCDSLLDDRIGKLCDMHAVACLREVLNVRHGREAGDLGYVCRTDGQHDCTGEATDFVGCYSEELLAVNGDAFDFSVVEMLQGFLADDVGA